MKTRQVIPLLVVAAFLALAVSGCSKQVKIMKIGWMKMTADTDPQLRAFKLPGRHQWKPEGKRDIQETNALMPTRNIWRSRHGDAMNSDEVTAVIGPVFELEWVSNPSHFFQTCTMVDYKGDVYGSPNWPQDRTILVKYNGNTGATEWTITSDQRYTTGDLPLVLDDPDNPGEQIIYAGKITEVLAVKPDGTIIYRKASGFPEPPETITNDNVGEYVNWGPNYNAINDGLFWVTGTGIVWGVDRKTGERNIEPFSLPGEKAFAQEQRKMPKALQRLDEIELRPLFSGPGAPKGIQLSHIVDFVLGERTEVANYFSIDQKTGSMWIAGTDLDEADGKKDGMSEVGALYRIDVVPQTEGKYQWKMKIGAKLVFKGGSASTPALRGDGQRGYVGDAFGNLVAHDYDCNIVWKYSLGKDRGADQIIGSVTVSSDNNELYCVTRKDVIKIVDRGDYPQEVWRAKIDMYENIDSRFRQRNLLTAPIAANGVLIQAGVGPELRLFGDTPIFAPLKNGVGLLDRKTGELRWFSEGKGMAEDSLAMIVPTPDGGILVPHSPVRRAIARGIFGDKTYPLKGGVAKYGPIRIDLMLRDIAVAGHDRVQRAYAIKDIQPEGAERDLVEVMDLIKQARMVAPRGLKAGDFTASSWNKTDGEFKTIEALHAEWKVSHNGNLLKKITDILDRMTNRLEASAAGSSYCIE